MLTYTGQYLFSEFDSCDIKLRSFRILHLFWLAILSYSNWLRTQIKNKCINYTVISSTQLSTVVERDCPGEAVAVVDPMFIMREWFWNNNWPVSPNKISESKINRMTPLLCDGLNSLWTQVNYAVIGVYSSSIKVLNLFEANWLEFNKLPSPILCNQISSSSVRLRCLFPFPIDSQFLYWRTEIIDSDRHISGDRESVDDPNPFCCRCNIYSVIDSIEGSANEELHFRWGMRIIDDFRWVYSGKQSD